MRKHLRSDESGMALLTVLLVCMLASALMAGMFAAISSDQRALGLVHAIGVGMREQAQERVAQLAALELARVVLDLIQQNRHQVDGCVHARALLEVPRHVGVVLERVQIHPWEQELAVGRIAIVGLVHVPQQHQVERRAHGSKEPAVRPGYRSSMLRPGCVK